MAMTPEERRAVIRDWFDRYLLRTPSKSDVDHWDGVWQSHGPEAVQRDILASDEGKAVLARRRSASMEVVAIRVEALARKVYAEVRGEEPPTAAELAAELAGPLGEVVRDALADAGPGATADQIVDAIASRLRPQA